MKKILFTMLAAMSISAYAQAQTAEHYYPINRNSELSPFYKADTLVYELVLSFEVESLEQKVKVYEFIQSLSAEYLAIWPLWIRDREKSFYGKCQILRIKR